MNNINHFGCAKGMHTPFIIPLKIELRMQFSDRIPFQQSIQRKFNKSFFDSSLPFRSTDQLYYPFRYMPYVKCAVRTGQRYFACMTRLVHSFPSDIHVNHHHFECLLPYQAEPRHYWYWSAAIYLCISSHFRTSSTNTEHKIVWKSIYFSNFNIAYNYAIITFVS